MQKQPTAIRRALLVDEHQLIPPVLVEQLERFECQIIRNTSGNEIEIRNLVQHHQPLQLNIVGVPVANKPNLDLLVSLRRWSPQALLLAITAQANCNALAREAGADIAVGYQKIQDPQLQQQVQTVLQQSETATGDGVRRVKPLNKRQQQILDHLVQGMSNKEISRTVYLSEGTVKNHVTAIFNYLGVTNRTQAAVKALYQTYASK